MITILISFDGYPDEKGKAVSFRAGETIKADDFPKGFIDMIVAKGLGVRKIEGKAK